MAPRISGSTSGIAAQIGVLAALFVLLPVPARATWSLVAVDPETREVGVAGASCIGGSEIIAGLAPGRGAVAAEAMANLTARYVAVSLLREGRSPREVVEAISRPAFDSPYGLPLYRLRQYGVAALGFEDEPATYTGTWIFGWAGSARGRGVSVQGNLLYGPDVVSAALAAFESAPCGASLADRLLAGLEAGGAHYGDRRCSKAQTALSAFLRVAAENDDPRRPRLHLVVPEQEPGRANPVALLRARYDAWRRTHPPAPRACGPSPGAGDRPAAQGGSGP